MDRFRIRRGTAAVLAVVAVGVVGGGVAYAAGQGGAESGTQPEAPGFAPSATDEGGQAPEGQMPPGGPGAPCGPGGPGGPPFEDTAEYLGISAEDLQAELEDGSTPGEVAEAEGKSADGLREALLDSATEKIDQGVEDGQLSEEQRDEILSGIDERIDAFVAGEQPPMPEGAPQRAPTSA